MENRPLNRLNKQFLMQNHICQVAAICTCVFGSSAHCTAHAKSWVLAYFFYTFQLWVTLGIIRESLYTCIPHLCIPPVAIWKGHIG